MPAIYPLASTYLYAHTMPAHSKTPSRLRPARALLLLALSASAAHAQTDPATLQTPSLYAQYGLIDRGTDEWTAGFTLPWKPFPSLIFPRQLSLYWDVGVSRWSAPIRGHRKGTKVLNLKPTARWRGNEGRSRWFVEAGVGMSYALHKRYATEDRAFSTRFNFASHAGAGYLFGGHYDHEVLLRVEHHSNASIKKPNPGENFLQMRYALHF